MALIVEDGTGKVDAESYVSVTNCDAYHTARGNSAWTGSNTVKEQYLREATAFLDGHWHHRWKGYRSNRTQALAWPRMGVRDTDTYLLDTDELPTKLIQACCELALRRVAGELVVDAARAGQTRRVKAGSVEVEYEPGAPAGTTYREVENLIRPYLAGAHRVVRA